MPQKQQTPKNLEALRARGVRLANSQRNGWRGDNVWMNLQLLSALIVTLLLSPRTAVPLLAASPFILSLAAQDQQTQDTSRCIATPADQSCTMPSSATPEADQKVSVTIPEKSQGDDRHYRIITLANNLRVLLVSDSDADVVSNTAMCCCPPCQEAAYGGRTQKPHPVR